MLGKKVLILLIFSILVMGCSSIEISDLSSKLTLNKNLRFQVKQLAISLDRSLKFLKMKQEKVYVEDFKPLNGESKLLGVYLKEKLKEELFRLGYLISTDGKGKVKVSGYYVNRGKDLEILAFMEGEGIKLSEASVIVSRKYIKSSSFTGGTRDFLTSER